MAGAPTSFLDEVGIAIANLSDAATSMVSAPTIRLGVTGLSRAGKTIFITALVHNLLTGGRMPNFLPMAEGRLIGVQLSEHPDRSIPRFAYETHLAALTGPEPYWPESTRRIAQIRLTLKFQSTGWVRGRLGPSLIHLDIVDYPGEWLLDLPLLTKSYAEWSADSLALAGRPSRIEEASSFLALVGETDASAHASDVAAEALAEAFTRYLRASRSDHRALSTLPPGRFLMPGDLEGSPALTFAPLPRPEAGAKGDSLYAMMERRYEAYKDIVIRPFFRDHFVRLDRQVVLVDALRAINAGPEAVNDLENALTAVLACFRQGAGNPISRMITRRIDRILFAATKADHVHHTAHPQLEAILNRIVADAGRRARFSGTQTRSLAIAAVRATREGEIRENGETWPTIVGTPEAGETLGVAEYDGATEIALFPGDLPDNPDALFSSPETTPQLRFLRFNPPKNLEVTMEGAPILPHIRLDTALDYLLGDRLA